MNAGPLGLRLFQGNSHFKAGVVYGQTFLRENDNLGIVYRLILSARRAWTSTGTRCPDTPIPRHATAWWHSRTQLSLCARAYDLTRGAVNTILWQADVKELAMYIEDQIKAATGYSTWAFAGTSITVSRRRNRRARVGIGYHIQPTSTVLSVSYARTLETPFNENLVLSSRGARMQSCATTQLHGGCIGNPGPRVRNEFHASLQQALARRLS